MGIFDRFSQKPKKRALNELIDRDDPGWPIVETWLAAANKSIEVLPADPKQANETLVAMQVTTRSPMGAVIHETGGILVDRGWLRILGSGHPKLPRDIAAWNKASQPIEAQRAPGLCLIADDAIGGFYAINGGALPGDVGLAYYFAQDTMEWEGMNFGYSGFLQWAMTGDLEQFYGDFRWPDWPAEVETMPGDRAFGIYPFLCAVGPPIAERSRRAVPINEIWGLTIDMRQQMIEKGTPQ